MEDQLRVRTRETSERLQRRIAYSFVNRTNTFLKFQKSSEERQLLKRTQSEHKKALKMHYKDAYSPKIMNLPQFNYQITADL
jgi:hypothetical protein